MWEHILKQDNGGHAGLLSPTGQSPELHTLESASVLGKLVGWFGGRGPPIQAAFPDPDFGYGNNVESVVLGRGSLGSSSSRNGPDLAI